MPIEDRGLKAGTVLAARYKKQDRTCEVVETPDGLRYRLDDGTEHKSPSSAGKAAMGGVACNGWRFWTIGGAEKPRREPKREPKAEKPKEERAAKKRAARKGAKKGGAKAKAMRAASSASYGCGACGETFPTTRDATAHLTAAHACE